MRATAADAVAAANKYTSYSVGYCLKWVVTVWQAPSIGCPSAIVSWEWALDKHPNDRHPPVGAPVFYRGGQYGHIAICTAPGRIRSTDCQGAGKVSEVNLDWPEKAWGYPYLGWTGDLSKVMLPLGAEPPPPEPEPEEDDDMAKMALLISDGSGPDGSVYSAPFDLSSKTRLTKASYDALIKLKDDKGNTYYNRVDVDADTLNRIPTVG